MKSCWSSYSDHWH